MERTSEKRAEAKREAVLKKRRTSVPDEREKEYLYWLCRVDVYKRQLVTLYGND